MLPSAMCGLSPYGRNCTPTAPLDPNTTYTVFIAAGAQSSHEVPMAPFSMSFTTGSQ